MPQVHTTLQDLLQRLKLLKLYHRRPIQRQLLIFLPQQVLRQHVHNPISNHLLTMLKLMSLMYPNFINLHIMPCH